MALQQPNQGPGPPARRRRLRDIAGGYAIDRWPIKIVIAQDETPSSWFRRVSDRYQLTPRQLCEAMDITLAYKAKITDVFDRHHEILKAALDVQVADFTTTHHGYLRSPWLGSFTESTHRFCPMCLQEHGYWNTSWRAPLSVACPQHRIVYADCCPHCGEQPWHTIAWLGQCAPAHICTARLPAKAGPKRKVGQWCAADLCQAPRIPAPDAVLQAQAFLTGGRHSRIDEPKSPAALFRFGIDASESREVLATLVGAAWTGIRGDPATPVRRANALHTGMLAYQELSTEDQPTPHLDQLSAVMDLDQILVGGTDSVGLYGPVIASWYVDRIRDHLTPRKQLGWRTSRTWPSLPVDPTTPRPTASAQLPEHRDQRACLPAAWIPQILAADRLTLPWEPDPVGCALAAMCLLNLGRGISWSYIALELGLPAALQHPMTRRLLHAARPDWRRFLSSLEEEFTEICQSPPHINYRHRRITAADPQLLRRCIAEQTSQQPQDVPQDWLGALWAAYTGGHIEFAPTAIISADTNDRAAHSETSLSSAAVEVTTGPLYARICQNLDAHRTHDRRPP